MFAEARLAPARPQTPVGTRPGRRRQSTAHTPGAVVHPPDIDNRMVVRTPIEAYQQLGKAPDGTPVIGANTPGHAYRYLQEKHGLEPHAAAGWVDNIQAESGFSPDVLSGRRRGDNGTAAYGFQWRGRRLKNFEKLAAQRGHRPGTLDHFNTQVDFAMMETDPNSPYADPIAAAHRDALLKPSSRAEGARAVARYFERPAERHIAGRPHAARIPGLDFGRDGVGLDPPRSDRSEISLSRVAPAVGEPQPAGLLGFDKARFQAGLAKWLRSLAERDRPVSRTTVRAPQNSFVSSTPVPWLAGNRG